MDLKIVSSHPLKQQTLEVCEDGVVYSEGPARGAVMTSRYAFDQIDAVVQSSEEPMLSIQIGSVIHIIPFRKDDETHRTVVTRIITGAGNTVQSAAPSGVLA